MRTQKNWFKMTLMTLAAVGLMIGTFTFSASAQGDYQGGDDQKEEDGKEIIVILDNQFEAGTKVKVKDLELLCVPTHKEIYEGGGKQTDGQKEDGTSTDGQTDDGKGEPPKDDYKYDHLACYKVKEHKEKADPYQGDDKKY
jgi:hypothetical protein